MDKPPLLVAVLGPTGSGKSDLGLDLASSFGGEIVNCDSVQIYRYMDIGTAKVPIAERRGIPHHLIDILDPDQLFTAGNYIRTARPLLVEIASRGRVPVIVGGTGFYYRSLIHGLSQAPQRNENLRARLENRRPGSLHRLLCRWSPETSRRIHPNDTQKLIRALEICLLARKPAVDVFDKPQPLEGFRILPIVLDPPADALKARIHERCRLMFESGLVDEARAILARGFPRTSKALEAIGYREALLYIDGLLTYEQAREQLEISTRQYAKRQRTWFRREPGVHFVHGFGNQSQTVEAAKRLVESCL